jgi:hypothetical protein
MFLKIAAVLAILGLLLTLLLAVAQQALLMVGYYGPGMQLTYKVITFSEVVSFTVPLIIFFVAFLISLKENRVE